MTNNSACVYLPSLYILWRSVCLNILLIFYWVVWFLIIEFREFFICTRHNSSIRYVTGKHFLTSCDLFFHSIYSVFQLLESEWSPIYLFSILIKTILMVFWTWKMVSEWQILSLGFSYGSIYKHYWGSWSTLS